MGRGHRGDAATHLGGGAYVNAPVLTSTRSMPTTCGSCSNRRWHRQFRGTFEAALSYFVASNGVCPEDTGFAIKGWTAVRFENSDVILEDTTALAMGNYFFTAPEGHEVKVEYTFGYLRDAEGALRIRLHHSSMPAAST